MQRTTIQPRLCETDLLGHINNTALPIWFEEGRNPFFELFFGSLSAVRREDWKLVLAHMEIDFVGELRFGTEVEIRSWIARVGSTSFTVYQEAWQGGVVCAKGTAVCVHYDLVARCSLPIPAGIRGALMEHSRPVPAASAP